METSYYTSDHWKWRDAKKKTFVVSDVGDYSLFIKKNLENISSLEIRTKHSHYYEPTQIISTEAGSVLYFNECVKDVFKSGCIYPARVVNRFKWGVKKVTAQDLMEAFNRIFNSKKAKKKIKRKLQFQPYHMYDWEWEVVTAISEEPKKRRCRRNKQLINQTQDGEQKNNKRNGNAGSRGYKEYCLQGEN